MFTKMKIIPALIILIAAALAVSGCGDSVLENAIEKSAGVEVEQKKNGEITVSSKDGELTLGGESNKLPEGFPLAAFPGSKIESSMTSKEKEATNYIVSLSSPKPLAELAAYYEGVLKEKGIVAEKMEIKDDNNKTDTIILNGKTDKLDVSVQIYNGDTIAVKGHVVNLIIKATP